MNASYKTVMLSYKGVVMVLVVCVCVILYYIVLYVCSIHFSKRPGATLDAGSIVAYLELDDPSRVQQVSVFCPSNMSQRFAYEQRFGDNLITVEPPPPL